MELTDQLEAFFQRIIDYTKLIIDYIHFVTPIIDWTSLLMIDNC